MNQSKRLVALTNKNYDHKDNYKKYLNNQLKKYSMK